MSSFEGYKPGKESREIDRAQREHVAGEKVRLGFARSHTETAKPMDTLKGMIKRAYKEGKLYSEKQASEAAGEVVKRLEGAGAKMRVSPGDRITFRNDSITLSAFDRKEARFVDIKLELASDGGEGSSGYKKREIVSGAQAARAELSAQLQTQRVRAKRPENPENPWEGKEQWEIRLGQEAIRRARREQPESESSRKGPLESLNQDERRRLEDFKNFLGDTNELQRIIRIERWENVQIMVNPNLELDNALTGKYPGFFFGKIAALKENESFLDISLGVNPKEGKVVLYNNHERKEFAQVPWKDSTRDIAGLKLALAAMANE